MKIKLAGIALSVAMLTTGVAGAVDLDPKFYVGGELQGNHYTSAKKVKGKDTTGAEVTMKSGKKAFLGKSGMGGSAIVGTRLNDNLALELGFNPMSGGKVAKKDAATTAIFDASGMKAKHQNIYADAIGLLPVSPEVDLVGSIGVGRLHSKLSGTVKSAALAYNQKVTAKSTKVGARVGAGIQYKINDTISARAMLRRQQGNKIVKSVNSLGLGILVSL